MNPTNEQLANLLSFLTESLKQVKDTAIEQAPELFREMIRYGIWENAMWFIFQGFVLVLSVEVLRRLHRKDERGDYVVEDEHAIVLGSLAGVVVFIFTGICLVYTLIEVGQLAFAPRMYLLEHVTSMLKASCK